MKATIYSTNKIVILKAHPLADGVPARIWEGMTQSGIKIHCYIARVAIDIDKTEQDVSEFEKELLECPEPLIEIRDFHSSLTL